MATIRRTALILLALALLVGAALAETGGPAVDNGPAMEDVGISLPDTLSGLLPHYVLNNNTMKFHYPDCYSVDKIKDENREDYEGARDELIARGYSPCGNCKP